MKKSTTPETIVAETPVGPRVLAPEQPWWKGNGRGYTREFIHVDETFECPSCHDEQVESAFPTLTVPRKDGRTRGHVCRACVVERRLAKKAKARRALAARKGAATRRAAAAAA